MARRQNQEGVGQDSRRGSNKARKNKPPDSDSESKFVILRYVSGVGMAFSVTFLHQENL